MNEDHEHTAHQEQPRRDVPTAKPAIDPTEICPPSAEAMVWRTASEESAAAKAGTWRGRKAGRRHTCAAHGAEARDRANSTGIFRTQARNRRVWRPLPYRCKPAPYWSSSRGSLTRASTSFSVGDGATDIGCHRYWVLQKLGVTLENFNFCFFCGQSFNIDHVPKMPGTSLLRFYCLDSVENENFSPATFCRSSPTCCQYGNNLSALVR